MSILFSFKYNKKAPLKLMFFFEAFIILSSKYFVVNWELLRPIKNGININFYLNIQAKKLIRYEVTFGKFFSINIYIAFLIGKIIYFMKNENIFIFFIKKKSNEFMIF